MNSKEDQSHLDEISLFWTSLIGSLTFFNSHTWQFRTLIHQRAWGIILKGFHQYFLNDSLNKK